MNIDKLTLRGQAIAIDLAIRAGIEKPKYTATALLPSGDTAAAIRFKRITANGKDCHAKLAALTAAGFDTDETFGGWIPSQCDTAFINSRLFKDIAP